MLFVKHWRFVVFVQKRHKCLTYFWFHFLFFCCCCTLIKLFLQNTQYCLWQKTEKQSFNSVFKNWFNRYRNCFFKHKYWPKLNWLFNLETVTALIFFWCYDEDDMTSDYCDVVDETWQWSCAWLDSEAVIWHQTTRAIQQTAVEQYVSEQTFESDIADECQSQCVACGTEYAYSHGGT